MNRAEEGPYQAAVGLKAKPSKEDAHVRYIQQFFDLTLARQG
jgi:hypothetical protein